MIRGDFEKCVTKPGSLRELATAIAIGGATAAAVYGAWLFVLLALAGGPISAGPATAVFGGMALHWSGTLGATVFAMFGAAVGPAGFMGWRLLRRGETA